MKTEIILAPAKTTFDPLASNPKPKFRVGTRVWAARVQIEPAGRIIASVMRCKVVAYSVHGFQPNSDSLKYIYDLKCDNDLRIVRSPSHVFGTEKEAAHRVYLLLHGYAEQIEKMAHNYFNL